MNSQIHPRYGIAAVDNVVATPGKILGYHEPEVPTVTQPEKDHCNVG